MPRTYWVYVLASRSRTLYVGVTNDLDRRVAEHRAGAVPGFTSRYKVDRLVYCESYATAREAIAREKQLKGWRRGKKVALVERSNPGWRDLARGRHPDAATPPDARRDPSTSSG